MQKSGTVYLVGAGPGDPGLLTLRGAEVLRRADVVLYDYLVNATLLSLAKEDATKICLGQHGRSHIWPQRRINEQIVEYALSGRTVVRLKGGDPAVFARVADEATALRDHGIPFEIVPGITTALAAPSYAGIPITHRDHASAVAFITGQENPGKDGSSIDYEALAHFPGTLVFYMGVTTVSRWTTALIDAGKPASTPVAVIRNCTRPSQQVLRSTLENVAEQLTPYSKFPPPAVAIVGEVVEHSLEWFTTRPLSGATVMVTRPAHQAGELASRLLYLGAEVILQPAIEVVAPSDWSDVDQAIADLESFDWLLFVSVNGVSHFCNRLFATGRDVRCLAPVQIAAVGEATADVMRAYGLRPDLIPPQARSESLAEALADSAIGRRFLLPRASRGRDVLARTLNEAGGEVRELTVYESRDVAEADETAKRHLSSGEIHWTTVTSSAIARSLVKMFGEELHKTQLVSISPITSDTLREAGFEPTVEAEHHTSDGLIQALLKAVA